MLLSPSKAATTTSLSKRLSLWSVPRLLVVHLKRFRFSHDGSEKVMNHVQFPVRNFSLRQYRSDVGKVVDGAPRPRDSPQSPDGALYQLVAVVVHHGRNLGGGHYTCFCKDSMNGRWYHFNDEHVAAVDEEVVCRSEAYMLFYAQQD